jgi:hypothetical protein
VARGWGRRRKNEKILIKRYKVSLMWDESILRANYDDL